jgi:hypothetical protein
MAAFLGLVDAGQDRVLLEFRRPRLLVHRQHPAAHPLAGEHLHADDPRRPQAFCKLRVHRHRDGGVAPAFLGGDLHCHLAHDLAQMRRPEAAGRVPSSTAIVESRANPSRD